MIYGNNITTFIGTDITAFSNIINSHSNYSDTSINK